MWFSTQAQTRQVFFSDGVHANLCPVKILLVFDVLDQSFIYISLADVENGVVVEVKLKNAQEKN